MMMKSAIYKSVGYDAVKSVFPSAQVIVHIDNAHEDNTWFFRKMKFLIIFANKFGYIKKK